MNFGSELFFFSLLYYHSSPSVYTDFTDSEFGNKSMAIEMHSLFGFGSVLTENGLRSV
jgi:hypothetical protein